MEGSSGSVESRTTNIDDGAFHYVTVTFDGSSNQDGLKIYIDGVLDATGTTLSLGLPSILGKNPVTICAVDGGGSEFTGQMDRVSVFDLELTAAEVAILAGI